MHPWHQVIMYIAMGLALCAFIQYGVQNVAANLKKKKKSVDGKNI